MTVLHHHPLNGNQLPAIYLLFTAYTSGVPFSMSVASLDDRLDAPMDIVTLIVRLGLESDPVTSLLDMGSLDRLLCYACPGPHASVGQ
jgi:hypothetical protein